MPLPPLYARTRNRARYREIAPHPEADDGSMTITSASARGRAGQSPGAAQMQVIIAKQLGL
jgi:hypothetical protein